MWEVPNTRPGWAIPNTEPGRYPIHFLGASKTVPSRATGPLKTLGFGPVRPLARTFFDFPLFAFDFQIFKRKNAMVSFRKNGN